MVLVSDGTEWGRERARGWSAAGLVLCWLVLGCFSGCLENRAADSPSAVGIRSGGPYTIVTTCGMVTDIVRQVAGPRAVVVGLMGEGVDPHLFKPKRNEVVQLLNADVVFYSGLMLEGRMSDVFVQVSRRGKPAYAVTAGLGREFLLAPSESGGHYDPHVWMDVRAWSQCVAFVARMLGEFDAPRAAEYRTRADRYRAELDRLDGYVRESVASIPAGQRVLVTAHDAFGYFARAYGMEVQPVQGISTESEAGVDDINRLVGMLVDRRIRAIFIESSVSEKNVRAIVEGAADRGWSVAIGGPLYSDAMGAAGSYEGTYIGMIDHNATVIARALGGSVPPRGLHGKLNL